VKSQETKNETDRTVNLIKQLEFARLEIEHAIDKLRGISLAVINLMLAAGEDFWGTDFFDAMKNEKRILGPEVSKDVMSEFHKSIEAGKQFGIEESQKWPYAEIKYTVEAIEQILDRFQPDYQKAVLKTVVDKQPQRDAVAAEENRRQEAQDKLSDTLDEWETEKIEKLNQLLEDKKLELQLQVA
jgi:hypothetical protein